MAITKNSQIDLNGNEMILDADGDTTITADTDDQIDIKVGGTDTVVITGGAMALKGATPTLTIGDAGAEDTKIVFDGNAQDYYIGLDDSADDLLIGLGSTVGTTPAISIDENVNVTLGSALTVDGFGDSTGHYISLRSGYSPDESGGIGFQATDHSGSHADGLGAYGHDGITFYTAQSEVMRISSGGDVRIGTSSQGAATVLTVSGTSSGGNGAAAITGTADNGPALNLRKTSTTTDSSARFIQFAANSGSTAMGGIGGNGASNAQFITLSDEREKENITPVVSVLDKVMNLNVVSFDWIKHDEHIKAGFIAQNVEKYFPEYVVENVSNEGEEERKGTTGGMSAGYIAVLTKAIQEQQAQIEALQSEINTLKGE